MIDIEKRGLNGAYIYRKELLSKFKEKYPDGDCIWAFEFKEAERVYNARWKLFYVKKDDAFLLMTDEPCIHYLPEGEIYRQWYTYGNYKEEN